MMLCGGSQARQVDGESDEEPWGYSHLEVQIEGSAPELQAGVQGRHLSLRTAGRTVNPGAGGRNQSWQKQDGGQSTVFLTALLWPSCIPHARPAAPWSHLKSTDPFQWLITLSAHSSHRTNNIQTHLRTNPTGKSIH